MRKYNKIKGWLDQNILEGLPRVPFCFFFFFFTLRFFFFPPPTLVLDFPFFSALLLPLLSFLISFPSGSCRLSWPPVLFLSCLVPAHRERIPRSSKHVLPLLQPSSAHSPPDWISLPLVCPVTQAWQLRAQRVGTGDKGKVAWGG